ncbi:MAG: 3-dehydroquinate synthase [Smithella sp. PtaU1.Bin162]|nr:MAG: 3-dehydroquinate synthase [Smithella sp. PtaU1.Bin162]
MSDSLLVKSLFRNYQVNFIGDFSQQLKLLVEQKSFFIIDAAIWELYKEKLKDIVPEKFRLIIEAGENNKSLDKCREIIEILVARKVRRNEKLVAIGGGVIQDITAFSASIIYRGIEWVFFPTTLLAQADSCIGSKTSINLGDKKNLVGNFYPPSAVFIDLYFLGSLSTEDIKSGLGEIMHYYIYAASPLFAELIRDYAMIIKNRKMLEKHIRESLQIKKSVIENDEFDRGERNKFNYGHTFGHALESVTDYAIKHGQAVTIGMDMANFVSLKTGFMCPEIFRDLHIKLSMNFPEFDWNKIDFDRYFSLLAKDKKNVGNNVGCILAREPGILIKHQLPLDNQFKEMIHAYFSGEL